MAYDVQKTDEQWREQLNPEEYAVLRQAGTERAFTGEYTDTETEGTYSCKACGSELFTSDTKFHSGCGWPSFYQPMTDTVEYIEDNAHGMKRVEVRCARSSSWLCSNRSCLRISSLPMRRTALSSARAFARTRPHATCSWASNRC
jgi:peptide-methionine (R)-S-oxide reductase